MIFYYVKKNDVWWPRKDTSLPMNDTKEKQKYRSKVVTLPNYQQNLSLKVLVDIYPRE